MIFLSVVVSGLTLAKTCWELEDVNIRINKFPKHHYPSWWSNLLIGCLWRFVAVICQVLLIVAFLMLLWLHLFSKAQFGSKKFDTNAKFNISYHFKGEDDSIDKYYVHLIPVILFLLPFVVNIWARWKYIGINDEYSIAHGFLSAVVPVRYVIGPYS